MKKIYLIITLLVCSSVLAADIPVTNPRLNLDGPNVNLNFKIAGAAPSDVRIMFCDCQTLGLDENREIQNFSEWYLDSQNGKSTIKKMLLEGWNLNQILSATASNKQFYIVFTR